MQEGKIILHRQEKSFEAGYCILRDDLGSLLQYASLLHPSEKEYYEHLKFDKRRFSYLSGRIAAKRAMSALLGCETGSAFHVDFGVFHFPVVKSYLNYNVQVSISHGDEVVVALAYYEDHPMGIDIEKIDPDKLEAIQTQLNPAEIQLISGASVSTLAGYTACWTIKEALSKIFKTGLCLDLKSLEIDSFQKEGRVYTGSFRHCIQYKFVSFIDRDYVCSIALPKKTSVDLNSFFTTLANTLATKQN